MTHSVIHAAPPKRKRHPVRIGARQSVRISGHKAALLRSCAPVCRQAGMAAAMAVSMAGAATDAYAVADPSTLTTVSGATSSALTAPGHLETTQTSGRAIITSPNVDVLDGESWRIFQPSASSALLVRVHGGSPTQILGELTANGQLMLVNGSGVFFGKGAQVNVAGLIASTADISNEHFNAGTLRFDRPGRADASIVNHGTITAREGGLVALLAPGVQNDGVITADLGSVALGAGEAFSVDFYGDHLYGFSVDTPSGAAARGADGGALEAGVVNHGTVRAGRVYMTADTARGVVDQAINTTGIVEASTAYSDGGDIVLDGGEGAVTVAGSLKASGSRGGSITVASTGAITLDSSAALDASGTARGGRVRVGGDAKGKGSLPRARTSTVRQGAVIKASAGSGEAGEVVVWSDKATDFSGSIDISSREGNGGFAEVSSADTLRYDGLTNALGVDYGTLLLDPGNWTISSQPNSGNNQNAAALAAQLNLANVTIDTATAALQPGAQGNITIGSTLTWHGPGSLTLNALGDVTFTSNVTSHFAGSGSQGALTINAGKATGFNSRSLTTHGGDITINTGLLYLHNGSITSQTGDITLNNSKRFESNTANNINTAGHLSMRQNSTGLIQTAIDSMGVIGGSVLLTVGNGFYHENVVIDRSMTLRSVNGRDVTGIRGKAGAGQQGSLTIASGVQNVVLGGAGTGFTFSGRDNGNPAIRNAGLTLAGANDGAVITGNNFTSSATTHGLVVNDSRNITLDQNQFVNVLHGAGALISGSSDVSITHSRFASNLIGVQLDNSRNTTLSDNVFENNATHFYGLNGAGGTRFGSGALTGGTLGVLLDGAGTDFAFSDAGSSFTNVTGYFRLQNGAMAGGVLDASQQVFDGTRAIEFTDAQHADARAKTVDFLSDAAVGFVFYRPEPVVLQELLDQLLLRDNAPLRDVFSYAGKTVDASYALSPYNFRVETVNLSLLSPDAGGPTAPAGPAAFSSLSPAAGGPDNAGAAALAALEPAAGGGAAETCGNSYLSDGLTGGSCAAQ